MKNKKLTVLVSILLGIICVGIIFLILAKTFFNKNATEFLPEKEEPEQVILKSDDPLDLENIAPVGEDTITNEESNPSLLEDEKGEEIGASSADDDLADAFRKVTITNLDILYEKEAPELFITRIEPALDTWFRQNYPDIERNFYGEISPYHPYREIGSFKDCVIYIKDFYDEEVDPVYGRDMVLRYNDLGLGFDIHEGLD